MSFQKVWVSPCPKCGRDVARSAHVPEGYRVTCAPELEGCGHSGADEWSEELAIFSWNEAAAKRIGARVLARFGLCKKGVA